MYEAINPNWASRPLCGAYLSRRTRPGLYSFASPQQWTKHRCTISVANLLYSGIACWWHTTLSRGAWHCRVNTWQYIQCQGPHSQISCTKTENRKIDRPSNADDVSKAVGANERDKQPNIRSIYIIPSCCITNLSPFEMIHTCHMRILPRSWAVHPLPATGWTASQDQCLTKRTHLPSPMAQLCLAL